MIILSLPYPQKPESKGYDLIEYRLDYFSGETFDLIKDDEKIIYTYRTKAEGGVNSLPTKKLQSLHKYIFKNTKALVDIELDTYLKNHDFYKQFDFNRLILSYHNFADFDAENLQNVITKALKLKCKYLKLAVNLDSYTDFYQFEQILKTVKQDFIAVGMGKLGILSRLMYKIIKSKATYVCQNTKTATGQITVKQAKLFKINRLNHKTIIGGLVGGKQVYKSLGIKYYNDYFVNKNVNKVYLPFEVFDIKDFMFWIKNKNFFGCSVTMPFKTQAAKYLKADLPFINLFLADFTTYNTDINAFKKAFEYLKITPENAIVVYGSGSTAALALTLLKSYPNITLAARNKQKEEEFCKSFELGKFDFDKEYDLAINCTPLAEGKGNFLKLSKIKAKKLIDLPYIQGFDTANKNTVSGKMFWHWQMQKQLELFIKR